MQKKTLGLTLANLRKSSGMTQSQLAERLGVSNKAVSHWEQDDSAPDLSLIPVIAELFGVTCDELLNGECGDGETFTHHDSEEKSKTAIDLNRAKLNFRIGTVIGVLLFLTSLIFIALTRIDHLFMWYAVTTARGITSIVLDIAALACQSITLVAVFGSLNVGSAEPDEVKAFKKRVWLISTAVISLSLGLGAFYLIGYHAPIYSSMIASAVIAVVIFTVLYRIFLHRSAKQSMSSEQLAVIKYNTRLMLKYTCIILAVVAVLLSADIILTKNRDFIMETHTEPVTVYSVEEQKTYTDNAAEQEHESKLLHILDGLTVFIIVFSVVSPVIAVAAYFKNRKRLTDAAILPDANEGGE